METDPVNFSRLEEALAPAVFDYVARLCAPAAKLRPWRSTTPSSSTWTSHRGAGCRVAARRTDGRSGVVVVANFSDWQTDNPAAAMPSTWSKVAQHTRRPPMARDHARARRPDRMGRPRAALRLGRQRSTPGADTSTTQRSRVRRGLGGPAPAIAGRHVSRRAGPILVSTPQVPASPARPRLR